jgi:hypothetical protein
VEALHMHNLGDYPESHDSLEFEVIEVEDSRALTGAASAADDRFGGCANDVETG